MNDDLIYLISGNSDIFIQNRINLIINHYEGHSLQINKYDLETTPIKTIVEDACTSPFLEEYKFIILRNPTILESKAELPKEYSSLLKYLKKPLETTILIINAANINIRKENTLYKELAKYAAIFDYSDTENVEMDGWLRKICSDQQINITLDASKLFLEYLNNDQTRMVNELDKLISYVGPNGEITVDTIKLLVSKDLSGEVFNFTKAIISQDKDQIFNIYQLMRKETTDVMGLLGLVESNINELFTVYRLDKRGYSQADIAKFLNVSSGRAYHLIKNAKEFDEEDLCRYISKLSDLDFKIKSGKIDKTLGFEMFLLEL